jgi:hypothetical protein
MSKTKVISASLRTEPRSAQAASSQPKPNDAFVELDDFVFGDGGNLASLKLRGPSARPLGTWLAARTSIRRRVLWETRTSSALRSPLSTQVCPRLTPSNAFFTTSKVVVVVARTQHHPMLAERDCFRQSLKRSPGAPARAISARCQNAVNVGGERFSLPDGCFVSN